MRIATATLRRSLLQWSAASRTAAVRHNLSSLAVAGRPSLSYTVTSTRQAFFSSDAQQNLVDILTREEQEEEVESGNLEMPQPLKDLKKELEADWTITEDAATTQLFLKSSKVQVSFHCQDTVEPMDEVYEEQDDAEEEEEESHPVRFTVTQSKAGKTLVVSCLSEFGQVKIESVTTTSTSPDIVHAAQGVLEKVQYQGPEFTELAEDLQESMAAYLEDELLVTSDVAAFVSMQTDYKEQVNYVQFLKDCKSIIS
jgi:complement component 1 Q subcomponent-binding protein